MASGKPVIYTDLKAIRQHLDVSEFGFLVNPKDSEGIANNILTYIQNPELYSLHAKNARWIYEKKYNWDIIKNSFLNFINNPTK